MLLLFAVYFDWISVEQFILGLIGIYVLRMVIMKLYAFSIKFPKLKFKSEYMETIEQLKKKLNGAIQTQILCKVY